MSQVKFEQREDIRVTQNVGNGSNGGPRGRGGNANIRKTGPKPHYPSVSSGSGEKLVERPAATVAMNANAILQPTRVVRVLARGEKLEP